MFVTFTGHWEKKIDGRLKVRYNIFVGLGTCTYTGPEALDVRVSCRMLQPVKNEMEDTGLDNNERRDNGLTIDKDAQIQVLVSNPGGDEDTIDLGRVFHTMKLRWRVYAWVLVLCMVVGLCAPLVLYQFTRAPLKVSSVVTLKYEVLDPSLTAEQILAMDPNDDIPMVPVEDLTAPNGVALENASDVAKAVKGEELDLTQITSSYVLSSALEGMELSEPVQVGALRRNIGIERILSEESRRQQEVAASMVEEKNSGAYQMVQDLQLKYENTFVVSLTNGFSNSAEDKKKIELTDAELRQLLDRILSAYNDYLVTTYADTKLPDDEISVIDVDDTDILESLDQLRAATQNLYDYCDAKPSSVKAYRSWRTGRSLVDWMETLETVREVNVEYLYSYVYTNSIVENKNTMITSYQYQLRDAQTELDVINENIATTQSILDTYKNDEIFVSMEESDATKSTKTTTDYYNELILQQTDNYAQAMELEAKIVDLQDKINSLTAIATWSDIQAEQASIEEANKELQAAIDASLAVYNSIHAHMEELFAQPLYTTYAAHSAALGRSDNFLKASMKNMIIGLVAGAVIGCGLWFLSGLAPEFSHKPKDEKEKKSPDRDAENAGKEAAEQ